MEIKEFAPVPAEIRVAPGTTVRWVNRDPVGHDVHLVAAGPGPGQDRGDVVSPVDPSMEGAVQAEEAG